MCLPFLKKNSFQSIIKPLELTIYFLKSTVFIVIFLLYFLKDFLSFTIQQSLFDNIKHTLVVAKTSVPSLAASGASMSEAFLSFYRPNGLASHHYILLQAQFC